MAYPGDDSQSTIKIDEQNEEMILLLKAILRGIEIIANQEPGTLLIETEEDL